MQLWPEMEASHKKLQGEEWTDISFLDLMYSVSRVPQFLTCTARCRLE